MSRSLAIALVIALMLLNWPAPWALDLQGVPPEPPPHPEGFACTEPGEDGPTELRQAFLDAYTAAPVHLGDLVGGSNGCVHQWGGYWVQDFFSPDNGATVLIHQPLDDRVYRLYGEWLRLFSIAGPSFYGAPIEDVTEVAGGAVLGLDGGTNGRTTFWKKAGGRHAWPLHGAIRDAYGELGWEEGPLGWPLSFEHEWPGGVRVSFENGYILCCKNGSEVRYYADDPPPPDVLGCVATGRIARGSIQAPQSDDDLAPLDTSLRFEVSYCKAENSTYLITGVRQWMELAPQTDTDYYWMSVTYGYYNGDEVQPTDIQNTRGLGCRPLIYGQSEHWSPPEEWRVTISANSGDTLGSKISNSSNCANFIRPIRLGGEEYPGAALLEPY